MSETLNINQKIYVNQNKIIYTRVKLNINPKKYMLFGIKLYTPKNLCASEFNYT